MIQQNSADVAAQNEMAKRMFCLEKALGTADNGQPPSAEKVLKTAEEYLKFISPTPSRIVTPR